MKKPTSHRSETELCLQVAQQISDPGAAEDLRIMASQYLVCAEIAQAGEGAGPTTSSAADWLRSELTTEAGADAVTGWGAMEACRVALGRGWLIKDARHWRYRGRLFSNVTVKRLIEEGTAVRVGNKVVQARRAAL